jgi:hypothetical protein
MNAEMSVERGARTLFRALVAWAAVCYVLSFVSAWWIPTPTDVGAVEYQGYAESRAQFTLPVVVEWGVFGLYVPVYVGLWWFKRLARAGLMALVLYTLFSSAFGGDWGGRHWTACWDMPGRCWREPSWRSPMSHQSEMNSWASRASRRRLVEGGGCVE